MAYGAHGLQRKIYIYMKSIYTLFFPEGNSSKPLKKKTIKRWLLTAPTKVKVRPKTGQCHERFGDSPPERVHVVAARKYRKRSFQVLHVSFAL